MGLACGRVRCPPDCGDSPAMPRAHTATPRMGQRAAEPIEGELAQGVRLQRQGSGLAISQRLAILAGSPSQLARSGSGCEAQTNEPQPGRTGMGSSTDDVGAVPQDAASAGAAAWVISAIRQRASGTKMSIEIGGATESEPRWSDWNTMGLEGAEQHAGAGHAKQQDGGAEQPLFENKSKRVPGARNVHPQGKQGEGAGQ